MPVDSPKDIARDEGIDQRGSSTFYFFIATCVIIGALLIIINHFYGVPPSQLSSPAVQSEP